MSFFTRLKTYRPRRVIKSEDQNALQIALEASFAKIGTWAGAGKLGVSTPFSVGTATASDHAVTKAQLDASPQSAVAAAASATEAAGYASTAEDHRDDAQAAQLASEGARDDSEAAQLASENARDEAQAAESSASDHKDAAALSATSAQDSATAAGNHVTTALGHANDAEDSADAAAASLSAVQTLETSVESLRDDAQSAQAASESARDDSQAAQTAAELARDEAQTAASGIGALSGLDDVTFTSPANGHLVQHSAGDWVNVPLSSLSFTRSQISDFGSWQPLSAVLTATTASYTTAEETKLSGIASGAQVNAPDASTVEMQEGTETNNRSMSPKDIADAIAAQSSTGVATLIKYGAI